MSTQEMETRIQDLQELKRMREELEAEITTMEDTIKAEMTARGTTELVAGAFKARWMPVTSSRFDTTAFKAEHPDLYTGFLKESTTRRFTVA